LPLRLFVVSVGFGLVGLEGEVAEGDEGGRGDPRVENEEEMVEEEEEGTDKEEFNEIEEDKEEEDSEEDRFTFESIEAVDEVGPFSNGFFSIEFLFSKESGGETRSEEVFDEENCEDAELVSFKPFVCR